MSEEGSTLIENVVSKFSYIWNLVSRLMTSVSCQRDCLLRLVPAYAPQDEESVRYETSYVFANRSSQRRKASRILDLRLFEPRQTPYQNPKARKQKAKNKVNNSPH